MYWNGTAFVAQGLCHAPADRIITVNNAVIEFMGNIYYAQRRNTNDMADLMEPLDKMLKPSQYVSYQPSENVSKLIH